MSLSGLPSARGGRESGQFSRNGSALKLEPESGIKEQEQAVGIGVNGQMHMRPASTALGTSF